MTVDFKKIIERIESKELVFDLLMSRPQSTQRDERYYDLFEMYKDVAYPQIITIPLESNNRGMYIERDLLSKSLGVIAQKISTKKGFEKHLDDFEALRQSYLAEAEALDAMKSEKIDLLRYFDRHVALLKKLADYAWGPIAVEKIVAPELQLLLNKSYPDGQEKYSVLASPSKINQFQRMRVNICDAAIREDISEATLESLYAKYHWYPEYSYVEKLYDLAFFKNEIQKLTKESAKSERDRIQNELAQSKEKVQKVLASIADVHTRNLAQVVNEYTYLRTERVDLFKQLQVPARKIFVHIAEYLASETSYPWTFELVARFTSSEIQQYLGGICAPDFETIQKRLHFVFYRNAEGEAVTVEPQTVEKIISSIYKHDKQDIKGSVAFRGKVRGKAVLVLGKSDLHKVTAGSILVARTTMPDYTHAMELAGAFVTEEGGITSHAAIIARELKKPCIVGTGNCTKLIKDGDMVEVDAESGIVRIL